MTRVESVWTASPAFHGIIESDDLGSLRGVAISAGRIELLGIEDGVEHNSFAISTAPSHICAAHAFGHIAIAGNDVNRGHWSISLWDPAGDETVIRFGGPIHSLAIGPDAQLAVGGYRPQDGIQLWNGERFQRLDLDSDGPLFYHEVAFSADGAVVMGVSQHIPQQGKTDQAILRAWDVSDGRLLMEVATEYGVQTAAFSPNAEQVLLASGNSLHEWVTPALVRTP